MNGPGNQSPGGSLRSSPYSKAYTNVAAPVDLTKEITQSQGASSFLILLNCSAVTYKDTTGRSVALTGLTATSAYPVLPVAATELTSSTGTVLVCWHPNATS